MTLDEELTALTDRWYRYVNHDHHKDRDCHFYLEKTFSYGNPPYYRASHNGYRSRERWFSPKFNTAEAAQRALIQWLKNELAYAIKGLEEEIRDFDKQDFPWSPLEQLQAELRDLRGEYEKEA